MTYCVLTTGQDFLYVMAEDCWNMHLNHTHRYDYKTWLVTTTDH